MFTLKDSGQLTVTPGALTPAGRHPPAATMIAPVSRQVIVAPASAMVRLFVSPAAALKLFGVRSAARGSGGRHREQRSDRPSPRVETGVQLELQVLAWS